MIQNYFRAYLASIFLICPPAAPAKGETSLIPETWNPALAGDLVLEHLVTVTAPQVKGAHDAEMAIVGDKAYIVAEVDDEATGESAARASIYSTLSIVRLDPVRLEKVIPIARGKQEFENETLPVGACFVPRIIQKDDKTLRCYFASERPGERQSQMWYRDFDLEKGEFAPTIHQAKLKTKAGTFPMQPQHFHADAVAHGFTKPAKDFGFYLFDSFKEFDGKIYVALNNFPGKQNALARIHDDFTTFEIVGHYNEPQSQQLSESAVNRLPDGTWMAICRDDAKGGNYHFTTSQDGLTWTKGEPRDFVPNGANSKPTFDKFGDLYYLGWQEATQIHGVHRSVFNVDISRDGKHWERKYRFETTKSFQYPTFREHDGVIWVCATQGDHSSSRKERIVFGKLEDVGAFASQAGKKRKPIPAPKPKPVFRELKKDARLFTNRDYTLIDAPEFLLGRKFLHTRIDGFEIECTTPGELYVMTLSQKHAANQSAALLKQGFQKMDTPEFQMSQGDVHRAFVYRKRMESGEKLSLTKTVVPVLGDGIEIKLLAVGTPNRPAFSETPEEAVARIAKREKIADHALVPPVVNTSPLPEYGYDRLDYGMTIGIDRTPGGRLWACWVAGGDSPDAYFVLASSDDEGASWSDPRVVLDSHEEGLGDKRSILVGNLWTDPKGRLWLFFDQSMDMFDGRGGVWATRCDNPDADEPTWTKPERIWHGVMLNKPTVLSTGEWMLPISLDQRPGFRKFKGCFAELDPLRGANVFVSTDEGESWERRGVVPFPDPDWHEHMVVERKDGSLWMLARTKRGIMEATSTDSGRTWSEPVDSAIQHPVARFFIRRLQSGKLLLIKHGDKIDAHEGRVQLSAWLSDDDGKTWQGGLVLDERTGISYPDGFQAPDGTIVISYDRNRATDGEILMARFTEEDVMAKAFQGPKSRAKTLISRPMGLEKKDGFTFLTDGASFDGWKQKGNWVIDDEGAFYRKERGGDLVYTAAKVPDDFELRFEWKVSKGCNSGVYYRPGQVEYQILDNIDSPYGANARQAAASLFFCMAPKKDNTRPVGEWNTGRIRCQGSVIEHWMNGEAVISFDYKDPKWAEYVELLGIRGGDLTGRGGQIKLQDHGQDVWFRNMRWREIPEGETITPDPDFEPMPVTGEALKAEQERVRKMLEAKK
ncbi:MAG: exo-alpha-sialidase [Verrucomicrobiales bacterium]|nr:exo-alpha-sialidase [Verrucomicrobiales bacterium]